MDSLLANFQDRSHTAIGNSGKQLLDKTYTENIDLVSPDVDGSFKSVIEITESTEDSSEEFKTDKKTINW